MQENFFQLLVFSFSLGQQVVTYVQKLYHGLYFNKVLFSSKKYRSPWLRRLPRQSLDKQVLIILEQVIIMKSPYCNSSTFFSVFWNPNYLTTYRRWGLFKFFWMFH